MKNSNKGLKHLADSTKYSLKGINAAIKEEAAFRQELLLVGVLLIASFFMADTFVEWFILAGPLFLLLIIELINSAIETVVDRIGADYHELSGRAKDMGSAAVFINLIFISITWIVFIADKFFFTEPEFQLPTF